MLTDDSRLTDDNTGSVVDEEILADGCARMNVNTGLAVRNFSHDTGNQRNAEQEELMRDPVDENCVQTGVAVDDFRLAGRSRVAVESRLYICLDEFTDLRDLFQEREGQCLCACDHRGFVRCFIFRFIAQNNRNLPRQLIYDVFQQHRNVVAHRVNLKSLIAEIAGENNFLQAFQNIFENIIIRQIKCLDLINRAFALIV